MRRLGWTTVSNRDDAERLARQCLEKELATGIQIEGPILSFAARNGKVVDAEEYRLVFHFPSETSERLTAWLDKNHPSTCPEWLTVSVEALLPASPASTEGDVSISEKGSGWVRENAVELFKAATQLLREKKYQEAEKILLQAYELDSHNTYVLVGLGDLYREQRKFEKAIVQYEKALQVDERNVFALRGIGDALRGVNQNRRAIEYWKRYLECNKDDIQVMTRIGDSCKRLDDYAQSESYYLQALSRDPKDTYALLGLGNLYYKMEKDSEALIYLEKLLVLDGGYVAALTMVGNIYRRRKEYEKAIDCYRKAVQREPGNTFALYGLGDCYRWLQDYQEVVSWWTKILAKEPENQVIHSRVGDAFLNIGDKEKAGHHYRKSLDIRFDAYALLGLAKIHRENKEFEKAVSCCREILGQMPRNTRAHNELHEIFQELGQPEKAYQILEELKA